MPVRIQNEDFDVSTEIAALREGNPKVGAVASFVGIVRDLNEGDAVASLTLEHYPGMTERSVEKIVAEARDRWDIYDALVIHRVGVLEPLDQIVLVVVSSAHRGESFKACEFLMDYLKTRAPFWKRNRHPMGAAGWTPEQVTMRLPSAGPEHRRVTWARRNHCQLLPTQKANWN